MRGRFGDGFARVFGFGIYGVVHIVSTMKKSEIIWDRGWTFHTSNVLARRAGESDSPGFQPPKVVDLHAGVPGDWHLVQSVIRFSSESAPDGCGSPCGAPQDST